jgi:hypothetical protein
MFRRGHGVKEAATRADTTKLFPATACSVWQDALYIRPFSVGRQYSILDRKLSRPHMLLVLRICIGERMHKWSSQSSFAVPIELPEVF